MRQQQSIGVVRALRTLKTNGRKVKMWQEMETEKKRKFFNKKEYDKKKETV